MFQVHEFISVKQQSVLVAHAPSMLYVSFSYRGSTWNQDS